MWDWITKVEPLFAVVGVLFTMAGVVITIYVLFLKPRRTRSKLLIVSKLMTAWFDHIDCNLEQGINHSELNNIEKKTLDYIWSELPRYKIKPSRSTRRAWLKHLGIKQQLLNSEELITNACGIPIEGIPLDIFFVQQIADFGSFHSDYQLQKSGNYNLVKIETSLQFFRFYLKQLGVKTDPLQGKV